MTQQTVNIGAVANDGTGDHARTAFDKINDNFDELYAASALSGGAPVAVQSVTTSGATLSLAPTAGALETSFVVTCTQDCLVSIGAAPTNKEQRVTVDFVQDATGGRDITFDAVSWAGGVGPTLDTVAGRRSTIMFRCVGSDIAGAPFSIGRVALIAALPVAPASITVTAGNTSNSVNAAPVTAYPAVTGYNVYRGASPGGESGTPIASNVSLPYSDTGLTNGTAYYYKVAAVNSLGAGAMSPEGSGTPSIAVPVHYAQFSGAANDNYLYATTKPQFSPGTNALVIDARLRFTSSNASQTIFSKWQESIGDAKQREYWFYTNASGRLEYKWSPVLGTIVTATATASDGVSVGTDATRRVVCDHVTGVTSFYVSLDGVTFAQVGTTVTAVGATAAGVQVPASGARDLVLGQESNGTHLMIGRLYSLKLTIASTVVIDAVGTGTAFVDSATPGGTATTWIGGPAVSYA